MGLFLALLTSLSALAATLEGHVQVTPDGVYKLKVVERSRSYAIYATNDETLTDIKKLNDGDELIARGQFEDSTVVLSYVDFVRLKNLLGFWENKSDEISMNVTSTSQMTLTVDSKSSRYTFAISPNDKTKWTLFLTPSDHSSKVIAGTLTFNNPIAARLLKLVIYDPDTKRARVQTTLLLKRSKS